MMRLFRFLLAFVLLAALSPARAPHTIPDISGDGAVHAISATPVFASYVQFLAAPGNLSTNCGSNGVSGCPRYGDSNISTSRGGWVTPGSGQMLPPTGVPTTSSAYLLDLSQIYYLVQTNDKVTIVWFD